MNEELSMKAYQEAKQARAENASLTNNGQITGMKILTQAEYDALPATKETDGVVYLIRG